MISVAYNTRQKNEIIAFFRSHPDESFTLDRVYEGVCGSGIGKSSVYRIAATLAEEGVLRKEPDGEGGRMSYQLIGCSECHEHLHLKCRECGRLVHLDEEASHALEQRLISSAGFRLDESALIYGKCESCSSQSRS